MLGPVISTSNGPKVGDLVVLAIAVAGSAPERNVHQNGLR